MGSPRNSIVVVPILIKRSSRGFGLELKSIKVFLGESNDYRIHHIIKVSKQVLLLGSAFTISVCLYIVSRQRWASSAGWTETRVLGHSHQRRGIFAEEGFVLLGGVMIFGAISFYYLKKKHFNYCYLSQLMQ